MRRGDIIMILAVLAVAVTWLVWPKSLEPAAMAAVLVDNEEVATIDLSKDGLYPVQGSPGAGILEVKDGRIRMQPMERDICPAGICCRVTGWIESATQSIICLPNRIVVSLGQYDDLDFITS